MGSAYEVIYGAGLLDDLHNYFPALLYDDPSRFSNVQSVLTYIQMETRRRFDLFSAGASRYTRQEPLRPTAPRAAAAAPRANLYNPIRFQSYFDDSAANNTLISLIFRGMAQEASIAQGGASMTPVIVRASPAEIALATTEAVYDGNLIEGPVCSICQDFIQIRDNTRTINHCQHVFHTNCVDVWLEGNVRCPVCRHDIRDVTPTP